jgi:ribonuclease P protein subunit POP4
MINYKDALFGELLMGELIGKKAEIVKSSRRELTGLHGTIVDETLKLFIIDYKGKEKKIPKDVCVFRIFKDGQSRDIAGKDLLVRPEDRIKKYWRKFDAEMRRHKLP